MVGCDGSTISVATHLVSSCLYGLLYRVMAWSTGRAELTEPEQLSITVMPSDVVRYRGWHYQTLSLATLAQWFCL